MSNAKIMFILVIIFYSIFYIPTVFAGNSDDDFSVNARICERYSEVYDESNWLGKGTDELKEFSDDFEKDITDPLSHILDPSGGILFIKEASTMILTMSSWNMAQSLGEMASPGNSYCEGFTTDNYKHIGSPKKAFEYMQFEYEHGNKPSDDFLIETKNLLSCYSENVDTTSANTKTIGFIKYMVKSSVSFIDYELGINEDSKFDTMVQTSVISYNSNFNTLKQDESFSKLMSIYGDEKILLTILPSNEFVSIIFLNGKIIDYEVGKEASDITLEVEIFEDTFEDIYTSENPSSAFLNAFENNGIIIKPKSLKMKASIILLNVSIFFKDLLSL